jgi:hypothetical protein
MTDIDIAMRADLGRQRKTKQAAALKKGKARNTKKMNVCKDVIMMWMKMKGLLLCHFSMPLPSPTNIYPMFEIAYNYDPLDIPSIVAAITDEESGAKRILLHAIRHKTFLRGVDMADKVTLAHFICRVIYSAVADTAAQRAAKFKMSKEPPPLRRVIVVKNDDVLNAPAAATAVNGGHGRGQARPRRNVAPGPGAQDIDGEGGGGGGEGGDAEDELAQVQRRLEHAKKEESIIDYFVDVGSKEYIKPGYMPKILQRKDVLATLSDELLAFRLPSTAHFNYDECIETLKSVQLEKERHREIMSEIGNNIPQSSGQEARESHSVKGPYCESIPADSWISREVMYTYLCNEIEFKTTTRKQKHAADMAKVNPARILAVAQTKPHGRSALVYWEEHYNDPEVKAAKKRCLQAIQESDDIVPADGTGEKSIVIDASDMGIQQANMTVAGPKDRISSKVSWKRFTNILFDVCTQMGEVVNTPLTADLLDHAVEAVIDNCTGENAHIFADVLMRALASDAIEESTKFGTKMKVKVAVADDEWNAIENNDDADDDGSDTEIVFFAPEE